MSSNFPTAVVTSSDAAVITDQRTSPAPGVPVSLERISCRYGSFTAVDGVSLDINAGEFVSLLGPSGSGKTTLLMNIAGFEPVVNGSIRVDGTDVTHVPSHRRDFGVVFQRYALFPHMNVADNVEYPLKLRSVSRAERTRRRQEALELVGLGAYAHRKPSQLSGGQQQRVALARVLVYRPPLILFDEPLGALDRNLREQVQLEIRRLNKELGITMLFVTHDQEEALVMSDRVALMRDGRIEQFGTGREIYYQPRSQFAAEFLGRTNLFTAEVLESDPDHVTVSVNGQPLRTAAGPDLPVLSPGTTCKVAIRPESIRVLPRGTGHGVDCVVKEAVFSGPTTYLTVRAGNQDVLIHGVSSDPEMLAAPGDRISVALDPEYMAVLASGA